MDSVYTFNDLMNINKFISSLQKQAKKSKIELNITDEKFLVLSDNIHVSGYFLERIKNKPGILEVASGKCIGDWLPILVHESCHMDQWDEKTDVVKMFDSVDSIILDNWIEGKDYSEKTINKVVNAYIEIELDCEKRSVLKIKKYKLPIDINNYIQKANSYIFFYTYLKSSRKWEFNPNAYKKAAKTWYDDYSVIPKEILQAFKKYKA